MSKSARGQLPVAAVGCSQVEPTGSCSWVLMQCKEETANFISEDKSSVPPENLSGPWTAGKLAGLARQVITNPICRLSVAFWPVQQQKVIKYVCDLGGTERLLLTKTTKEPCRPAHLCSCGLPMYFSPPEDSPEHRQFSADNVNLLIKTYVSEKVKTWLWMCEWFIIQMKGELRLTGYKHCQLVFFQFMTICHFILARIA